PAQLRAATLRSRLPLLASALAREHRGGRAVSRRTRRNDRPARALRRDRRQLVGDHETAEASDVVHLRLYAGCRRLSGARRRAALFLRSNPARRTDADRAGIRTGSGGAELVRLCL